MAKTVQHLRKNTEPTKSAKTLGASKADKFALVEGVRLNAKSAAASALTQRSGLQGDAYREAITGMFRDKRGK